jgi:hypothetical protein
VQKELQYHPKLQKKLIWVRQLASFIISSEITEKADVYSFGVVVMEIISGRKNLDTSRSEESIHLITLLEKKVK